MQLLRLKEVLKDKGVTGKDLSDAVGVTTASISNIVNGNHFPKPELLKSIADHLDVDIRELFIPTKEDQTAKGVIKEIREKLDWLENCYLE
ncbi:helix-turn-helix domain-containing protein [Bizionia paragorgiae]|uniref:helix-turn-helix domain-containing protein n=1 Tax=Bizionia paragorgiae TaxID=283786 RepID=UPI003A9387F2